MTKSKTGKLILGALLSLAAMGANQAWAQADQCGVEREIKQGLLDEATFKRMNTAYELVGEERYDEAYAMMTQLRERGSDPYVQAVLAQGIAQVEWARENYDKALKEFELAVELDALPNRTHYSLMYQIAQLYFMQERFDEALERLELWFCKIPPEDVTASAYVLKASIHTRNENWPEVLAAINQAIEMDPEPKENWYQLKLAAHFELNQWVEGAETLEVMISKWPDKKTYWTQLSNTYFKLENDTKALSVIALAYRKGMLDTQADLLYLANLYSFGDVPFKAASVMQKGIEDDIIEDTEKNWTIIGDNWFAAQEYENALAAFERAGRAAEEGDIDLRRGFILVDMEQWDPAVTALQAALEKGGLTDNQTGEAYLMLGLAEFSRNNFDQASSNWDRAARFEKTRSAAQQWKNHMREERARKSASR
jgi:tetratricopeptide (TPR) repeat protein